MSKRMRWRSKRGGERWESDAGYVIRKGPNQLAPYRVVAPGVPAITIGGSSTLLGAQEMANDHASGDFVKRRLARIKGEKA